MQMSTLTSGLNIYVRHSCLEIVLKAGFPLGEIVRANGEKSECDWLVSVCHQPIKLLLQVGLKQPYVKPLRTTIIGCDVSRIDNPAGQS